MEYIFRDTVSSGVNAHVRGWALDLYSFQRYNTRIKKLFVLVSINLYREEHPKEFAVMRFSWSVNFGDEFATISLKLSINFLE